MKKRTLRERLFWSPNYFTIAIRRRGEKEAPIWKRRNFHADYVIPASRDYWVADPMLAEDRGKTYLFYEAAHHNMGRIEVVEILPDGTTSLSRVAVEREYHLSYPFVFRHAGEWYMIPESCASNEVQLLRAKHFPEEWEYQTTLLKEYAVDTTVQEIEGKLLLLTFIPQTGSERVTPKAFWMEWNGAEIHLQEISWQNYEQLKVRGAGRMILDKGTYIRPAQVNQETSYGDGVLFYKSSASTHDYREAEVGSLQAGDLDVSGWKVDGLHTYAVTEKFEVIDVRCQLPDPWKLPRRLLGR